MRILLSALTLIGLLGCDSGQELTSVNSTSPASQRQSNGTAGEGANQSKNSPTKPVSDGAKTCQATNLDGVYIVKTSPIQNYIERATGQSTDILEILSDKPLWFTITEGNSEPECISFVFAGFAGDEKTLTHQYFVSSTRPIGFSSVNEGATYELPVRLMHIRSNEVTLDEALSMADGKLIDASNGVGCPLNFQFTIPPWDPELTHGLSDSPNGLWAVGPEEYGVGPIADPKNKSLQLINIGRRFMEYNEDMTPKRNGVIGRQSFITIRVQLESAPTFGASNLQALTKLGGKWRGSTLDLSGTRITDKEVFHVVRMMKFFVVDTLDLSETEITDKGLEQLMGSKNRLKKLRLSKTQVSDEGVAKLQKSLPDCELVF